MGTPDRLSTLEQALAVPISDDDAPVEELTPSLNQPALSFSEEHSQMPRKVIPDVTTYIALACIFVACIAMAYIVMAEEGDP